MAVVVSRIGPVILAVDEASMVSRRFECRAVQAAVELANKLTNDQVFAARWVMAVEPESSEVRKPHHHERPYH